MLFAIWMIHIDKTNETKQSTRNSNDQTSEKGIEFDAIVCVRD